MIFTEDKIRQLIAQGENSAIEFKNAAVTPADLAKEMVAFANSNGGVILLGVSDDGALSGVPKGTATEEWVADIARNNVLPSLAVETGEVKLDKVPIRYIIIPKGRDKPYQTQTNRFLVRIGSTNRVATQHELLRFFQQSGVFHYDSVPVEGASLSDLNFSKLAAYFSRYGIDFSHENEKEYQLKNTDILAENGEPTIGGLLVFGIQPQRFLRQAYITFAHFKGNEISDTLIDRQDIEGTLDSQIDNALAVIKNNIQNPSTIQGAKTVSTSFQYPEKVYRELLTNACIHRNYAIQGSQIRVFQFDDRIEFRSPGRLPNTVTIEKITRGVSYAVNPILLKFMQNLGYIDKLGRGIPMVWQAANEGGKKVIFEEIGEEFNVTLFF